jgi:hypothetical protein
MLGSRIANPLSARLTLELSLEESDATNAGGGPAQFLACAGQLTASMVAERTRPGGSPGFKDQPENCKIVALAERNQAPQWRSENSSA